MTLNVRRVDVATVPFVVPERTINTFKVRGLSTSRLMSADIRYGVAQPDPETVDARPGALKCVFDDAYTLGVCLQNEHSYLHAGGRAYSVPRRRGEAHILYLAELQHVDVSAPHHTTEIILTRKFMREIAGDLEVPEVSELGRDVYHVVADPVLEALVLRAHPFFDMPQAVDPLLADHWMWGLGIYVCSRYGGLMTRRPVAGGLSTWQIRLAKEIIEARLVEGIGLTDLAAICGLGTSQFSHGFKRSTGMAPYQWLMQRRIARAREMMSGPATIAEIALATGFSDQSHLGRVFVREIGVSPARYRSTLG